MKYLSQIIISLILVCFIVGQDYVKGLDPQALQRFCEAYVLLLALSALRATRLHAAVVQGKKAAYRFKALVPAGTNSRGFCLTEGSARLAADMPQLVAMIGGKAQFKNFRDVSIMEFFDLFSLRTVAHAQILLGEGSKTATPKMMVFKKWLSRVLFFATAVTIAALPTLLPATSKYFVYFDRLTLLLTLAALVLPGASVKLVTSLQSAGKKLVVLPSIKVAQSDKSYGAALGAAGRACKKELPEYGTLDASNRFNLHLGGIKVSRWLNVFMFRWETTASLELLSPAQYAEAEITGLVSENLEDLEQVEVRPSSQPQSEEQPQVVKVCIQVQQEPKKDVKNPLRKKIESILQAKGLQAEYISFVGSGG